MKRSIFIRGSQTSDEVADDEFTPFFNIHTETSSRHLVKLLFMSLTLRTLSLLLLVFFVTACSTKLSERNLLVIGDSNGEREGWVYQLQSIRGGGPLVNTSLSGNTIGFNYDGDRSKNTLENLNSYLRKGYAEMGGIDEILICLGTNDCKARFADEHKNIKEHLANLVDRAASFFADRGQAVPRFVIITPPAMDDTVLEEFAGGESCITTLTENIRSYAAASGICVVDLQKQPGRQLLEYSEDGIHFNAVGYKAWAEEIIDACY